MRLDIQSMHFHIGKRRLFEDVTLALQGPATIALMGPSGSGKSTLLALVSRELKPTKGAIVVEDAVDRRSAISPSSHHAWVFQTSPMLPHRTALDNTMIGPLSVGEDITASLRRSLEAMQILGISHLARKRAFSLSGGEKQRVSVARAIAARSRLILADEPTASLDPDSKSTVIEALTSAARTGALVLVATHDEFVANRCDRTLRIGNGRMSFD